MIKGFFYRIHKMSRINRSEKILFIL